MSRPLYDRACAEREQAQVRSIDTALGRLGRGRLAMVWRRTADERQLRRLGFPADVAVDASRRDFCGASAGVAISLLTLAIAVWLVLR